MARLLEIFSEGALYDEALEQALGVDTWQLDNAWRESIGAQTLEVPAPASNEKLPDEEELVPATGEPIPDPTLVPAEVEETPSASEEPPSSRRGGLALPCLGSSLVGVAVMGLFLLFRVRGSIAL